MKTSEQTNQQIGRALRKVAAKLQAFSENPPLTDIYLQVRQDSGELLAFNDEDEELTRCVVEEWIGNTEEDFYDRAKSTLQSCISRMKDEMENLNLLKPYSFVMVGEDKEVLAELYLVDGDTIILDGELMKGLEADLDTFWETLMAKG